MSTQMIPDTNNRNIHVGDWVLTADGYTGEVIAHDGLRDDAFLVEVYGGPEDLPVLSYMPKSLTFVGTECPFAEEFA